MHLAGKEVWKMTVLAVKIIPRILPKFGEYGSKSR
jgi:hypothetical protein